MKNFPAFTVLVCLLVPSVLAQSGTAAPSKYESCVACHGAAGQGNAELNAPAIAGQGAVYLERQLRQFKAGIRGGDPGDVPGAQMGTMAGTLTDEDMLLLATYLSGLPRPNPPVEPAGDLKNGNNYYQSKCGACHGGQAQGNPGLNAQALVGLDAAYLKQQFHNFQQGLRGAHPEDTYGRQMKMMSTSLPTEKDLDDVIAYIQSMNGLP
jgi:cytochrome c553